MRLLAKWIYAKTSVVAEHLGCPLLRADPTSIQPNEWQTIYGYDATLTQFLKDATEWGGLVLFDGSLSVDRSKNKANKCRAGFPVSKPVGDE